MFAALIAASITAAPVTDLEQSGRWQLREQVEGCMLSRRFTDGDNSAVFSIQLLSFAPGVRFGLELGGWNSRRARITAVTFVPRADEQGMTRLTALNDPSEPNPYRAAGITVRRDGPAFIEPRTFAPTQSRMGSLRRAVSGRMPEAELAQLDTAGAVIVELSNGGTVRLTVGNGAAARAALNECQDRLLSRVGVPALQRAQVARPPVADGKLANWFTYDPLPWGAFRNELVATVAPSGRVRECRVAVPSGEPAFDRLSCVLFVTNGRFRPALDAQGNPTEGFYALPVTVWDVND
ncbi:MAG: energy transducer TonB [Sphingomonas sp.]|nr:energy transducer TonB [Sphingomonas sp.]